MLRSLQYSILFTVPVSVALGILWGGIWTFFTPFYLFVLIPTLDHLSGLDTQNPNEEATQSNAIFNLWL